MPPQSNSGAGIDISSGLVPIAAAVMKKPTADAAGAGTGIDISAGLVPSAQDADNATATKTTREQAQAQNKLTSQQSQANAAGDPSMYLPGVGPTTQHAADLAGSDIAANDPWRHPLQTASGALGDLWSTGKSLVKSALPQTPADEQILKYAGPTGLPVVAAKHMAEAYPAQNRAKFDLANKEEAAGDVPGAALNRVEGLIPGAGDVASGVYEANRENGATGMGVGASRILQAASAKAGSIKGQPVASPLAREAAVANIVKAVNPVAEEVTGFRGNVAKQLDTIAARAKATNTPITNEQSFIKATRIAESADPYVEKLLKPIAGDVVEIQTGGRGLYQGQQMRGADGFPNGKATVQDLNDRLSDINDQLYGAYRRGGEGGQAAQAAVGSKSQLTAEADMLRKAIANHISVKTGMPFDEAYAARANYDQLRNIRETAEYYANQRAARTNAAAEQPIKKNWISLTQPEVINTPINKAVNAARGNPVDNLLRESFARYQHQPGLVRPQLAQEGGGGAAGPGPGPATVNGAGPTSNLPPAIRQAISSPKEFINGSGESDASMEAINRLKSEKGQGIQRLRIDTRLRPGQPGYETPILGPESVDARVTNAYQRVVRRMPDGSETVLDEGSKARPTPRTLVPQEISQATTPPTSSAPPALLAAVEDRIPVLHADGTRGTVPRSQLRQALGEGYKLAEPLSPAKDINSYGTGNLPPDLTAGAEDSTAADYIREQLQQKYGADYANKLTSEEAGLYRKITGTGAETVSRNSPTPIHAAAQTNDLQTFSRNVNNSLDKARQLQPDFGKTGDKVFVSRVYETLRSQYPDMTLPQFKARLLQAHQQGLVTLSRADMAPEYNQADVRASHIQHPVTQGDLHFLQPVKPSR